MFLRIRDRLDPGSVARWTIRLQFQVFSFPIFVRKSVITCFVDERTVSKNRRRKLAAKARKVAKERSLSQDDDSPDPLTTALNVVSHHSNLDSVAMVMATSLPVGIAVGNSFGSLQSHHKKAKSRSKLKRQKSDPIRLMSPLKNKCQHEEKIAKALENREQILQEKSEKVRMQNKKVVEVLHSKAAAIQQIRENLSDKMQRAERKREMQLTTIKSKARDEAVKVDEINFINNMKSQDRIRDVIEKVRIQGPFGVWENPCY